MNDQKIKELLIEMLGSNAYNNNMIVERDLSRLVKAVNYLTSQIEITKRWCDDEGKDHINKVIETTVKILQQ